MLFCPWDPLLNEGLIMLCLPSASDNTFSENNWLRLIGEGRLGVVGRGGGCWRV